MSVVDEGAAPGAKADESGGPGAGSCFHCGSPMGGAAPVMARLGEISRPCCCSGCARVAELIWSSGWGRYYELRTGWAPRAGTGPGGPSGEDRLQGGGSGGQGAQGEGADGGGEQPWYEIPELLARCVRAPASGRGHELDLLLEGVTCGACLWLIEQRLATLPGVEDLELNWATRRARVRLDPERTSAREVLGAIGSLGYGAVPFTRHEVERSLRGEYRAAVRHVLVAGLLAAQIMTVSLALYFGEWYGMEEGLEGLLRWSAFALAVPLLAFSAPPFFAGAWRAVRGRHLTMDVPVALAVTVASAVSLVALVRGRGDIYFDSAAMFLALLHLSRLLELSVRKRALETFAASLVSPPERAHLVVPLPASGPGRPAAPRLQSVPAATLKPGDRVLVRRGETVPADGALLGTRAVLDEALLSGESRPVVRHRGERLPGGAVNLGDPVELRVEAVGEASVLGRIEALTARAAAAKPPIARLADRVAGRFVAIIVLLALGTALFWGLAGGSGLAPGEPPGELAWLTPALTVLIVSCPCALALAIPLAVTASLSTLAARGLVVREAAALDVLPRVTDVVLDKTGTLTDGRFRVLALELAPGSGCSAPGVWRLAAALEAHAEHPLARAFDAPPEWASARWSLEDAGQAPERVQEVRIGEAGVSGVVDGVRYRLGRPDWALGGEGGNEGARGGERGSGAPPPGGGRAPEPLPETPAGEGQAALEDACILLAAATGTGTFRPVGWIRLGDHLRPGARELVQECRRAGVRVHLLSGDAHGRVVRLARGLGIESAEGGLSPEGKLARLARLRRGGEAPAPAPGEREGAGGAGPEGKRRGAVRPAGPPVCILALGDGTNDAPVLAAADTSIAMGEGTRLARGNADALLVSGSLRPAAEALALARKTRRVIRQNLAWALGYNAVAVPAAMAGLVPPWLAALGMAASSVAVVLNSARLHGPRPPAAGGVAVPGEQRPPPGGQAWKPST